MFDCYLKRVIYNKKFEMTYVALSQVNNNKQQQHLFMFCTGDCQQHEYRVKGQHEVLPWLRGEYDIT